MKTTEQYFQEFYNEVRYQIEQGAKANFTRANQIWAEYEAAQHCLHTDACPECEGRGWIPNGQPDDCDACNGTGKRG